MLLRQAKRAEIGVPIGAFMLTSVGELNANKNHSVAVRALSKTDKRVHYVVAGKGELEKKLRILSKENKVSKRVHLLGFCTDIPELYKASDCCVFPSIREGNRGTRRFVEHENGIVCKHDNPDAFSRAVTSLFRDRKRCEKMKKCNIEKK